MYKLDYNHLDIVNAFRDAGCPVAELARSKSEMAGIPDLSVGIYNRRLNLLIPVWVEIKSKKGKLSSYQLHFHTDWEGAPYAIVTDIDDVVEVLQKWQNM